MSVGGHAMRGKNGCVVCRSYLHACPTCNTTVEAKTPDGRSQVRHRDSTGCFWQAFSLNISSTFCNDCWTWVGNLNNCALWVPNKDVEQAHPKGRLRNSKAPCCWGTEAVPPNVACSSQASKMSSKWTLSGHLRNRKAVCRWGTEAVPTVAFLNWQETALQKAAPRQNELQCCRRTRQEESQNYGGDSETQNPNAAEEQGGPAGWGCQCLMLLSGISRRKPKLPWGWRNAKRQIPMLLKDAAAWPEAASA